MTDYKKNPWKMQVNGGEIDRAVPPNKMGSILELIGTFPYIL